MTADINLLTASSVTKTFAAAVAVIGIGVGAVHWLTLGFSAWTTEAARRLTWESYPGRVPAVVVEGPGLSAQPLPALFLTGDDPTLVDFVYTNCESVCSALGSVFQRAQSAVEKGQRIRLLSISFDADRDDVATLEAYAKKLEAESRFWRFARVLEPSRQRELLDAFGITVRPDGRGGFEHNAALLVVDPNAQIVRAFDPDDLDAALSFAKSVRRSASAQNWYER